MADSGGSGLGGPDTGGSGPGGWFANQGLFPDQNFMPGAGFSGQGTGLPNSYGPLGGYAASAPGSSPASPFDFSVLESAMPGVTQALLSGSGSGGGFAPPAGYPDQTPPLGSAPGSGGLAGGPGVGPGIRWTNPNDPFGGQGDWTNPLNSLGGYGGQVGGSSNPDAASGGMVWPGAESPGSNPYDPSHLDQLIPHLTAPLPSGIGYAGGLTTPSGYPDQTPPLGSGPEYGLRTDGTMQQAGSEGATEYPWAYRGKVNKPTSPKPKSAPTWPSLDDISGGIGQIVSGLGDAGKSIVDGISKSLETTKPTPNTPDPNRVIYCYKCPGDSKWANVTAATDRYGSNHYRNMGCQVYITKGNY
ncbi:MAG: hypothetical protein HQK81_09225 [Desulfovibrionaceae bacterium]|nr:hypothetical protein [Desulfovibrionaceae bacterium]